MKAIEILRNAANDDKNRNIRIYLQRLLQDGFVRTGYYKGRGRHTRAVDDTYDVVCLLKYLHIAHAQGNDAPRGGVTGNFVIITSQAIMKEIGKSAAYKAMLKEAGREWRYIKQHPYSHDELIAKAEEEVSFIDPTDEQDEEGRYWMNTYHGCGVYELAVKDGRIAASVYGGFRPTRPHAANRITPSREEWVKVLNEVVTARIGEGWKWAKADGSGTYFYLRDEDDAELFNNVKEYDVPDMMQGGLHHNIEIR